MTTEAEAIPVPTAPELGISGMAAYFPPYRVQLQQWCEWTGASWDKIRAVVGNSFRVRGPTQSIYTLAATSVLRLIDQYEIDPSRVGFLGFGTESSTDNSAGAVIIKGMVDDALRARGRTPLSRQCEVPEFKHACLGGLYAAKGALRYLALDGRGRQAIVVSADIAEYARGSSGEPTQGAGAVAMLLECSPTLAVLDLPKAGSASDYRLIDFRKPMLRFSQQAVSACHELRDFPVFNGKYSTTCYVDETWHALLDMCAKQDGLPIDCLRGFKYLFMHRPYQKMPETGWAVAYLLALANGHPGDQARLADYATNAGVDPDALAREMNSAPEVARLADPERLNEEAYPLTMLVARAFRTTDDYQTEVLAKLALGSGLMADLGNLYTGALPAWIAAGFEQAAEENSLRAGDRLLAIGYGSGDAAEAIPMRIAEGWREAAQRISLTKSMDGAIDLTMQQYHQLHDGLPVKNLMPPPRGEFVIERVGRETSERFQDIGIEYYAFRDGHETQP